MYSPLRTSKPARVSNPLCMAIVNSPTSNSDSSAPVKLRLLKRGFTATSITKISVWYIGLETDKHKRVNL